MFNAMIKILGNFTCSENMFFCCWQHFIYNLLHYQACRMSSEAGRGSAESNVRAMYVGGFTNNGVVIQ